MRSWLCRWQSGLDANGPGLAAIRASEHTWATQVTWPCREENTPCDHVRLRGLVAGAAADINAGASTEFVVLLLLFGRMKMQNLCAFADGSCRRSDQAAGAVRRGYARPQFPALAGQPRAKKRKRAWNNFPLRAQTRR